MNRDPIAEDWPIKPVKIFGSYWVFSWGVSKNWYWKVKGIPVPFWYTKYQNKSHRLIIGPLFVLFSIVGKQCE